MTHGKIRPLAVTHLREAFAARDRGDHAEVICSLMAIDAESWQAMHDRLIELGGGPLAEVLKGRTADERR